MSIRLDLYKIFDQVAKCQSFSQAADRLFMTQPAVSQAMQQLENEFGVRLFTRTSQDVTLTNEGRTLVEYTSSALNLLGAGEKKLKDIHALKEGDLIVGATDTICRHYLLPFFERFSIAYPRVKLKIVNRTTEELCTLVKSGEISLAVCNLPLNDETLETRSCKGVRDVFLANQNYKRRVNAPLSFSKLAELPLIFLDQRSRSRRYVEEHFLAGGMKLKPEIELGSHDLLLDLAKIGLGVCCAILEFSTDYLINGELFELELEIPIPSRDIGVCYLGGVSLSPSALKFVELLLN